MKAGKKNKLSKCDTERDSVQQVFAASKRRTMVLGYRYNYSLSGWIRDQYNHPLSARIRFNKRFDAAPF